MQRCSIDLPQRICGYLFRTLLQNILPQVAVWAALRNNFSSTTTCCTRKKICVLRRIYDYMRQLIRQSGYVLRCECSCLTRLNVGTLLCPSEWWFLRAIFSIQRKLINVNRTRHDLRDISSNMHNKMYQMYQINVLQLSIDVKNDVYCLKCSVIFVIKSSIQNITIFR